MSHYAFRPKSEALELEVDWVVVGSGAGGATAAVSLARGGEQVAVVEAGAWRDPDQYPLSAYGGMRDLMPEFGSSITTSAAQWPIVQGKAVGGTTVINSAICVRTPGDIFAQWQREHGLPDYSDRIWAIQDQLENELAATETPLALGRTNQLALQGAEALGYESHLTTRYVKDCSGSGQCLQGCGSQRKQSLNLNFIPETARLGGAILSCAPVNKVLLEGRRAVGVTGHFRHPRTRQWGARFTVRARKGVMMAASVLQSPVLLLRSGVRNRRLGHDFRAHPGTGVFGVYDDIVDMNKGATQGWASTAYRDRPGFKLETLSIPPELVASRLKGGGKTLMKRFGEYRHLAMWVMAVRAESVGTVSRGPFGPIVRYILDEADMRRLRDGAVRVAQTHFAAGASYVIPGVHGLPYKLERDQISLLEEAPLQPWNWVGVLSHLFGGCVMGSDPRRSVCDERGRVHGYRGLIIADASQIPSNLGVNPQHTIMALARLRAEQAMESA